MTVAMSEETQQGLIFGVVLGLIVLAALGGATKSCQWDHVRDVERIRAVADCSAHTGKPLDCKAAINP